MLTKREGCSLYTRSGVQTHKRVWVPPYIYILCIKERNLNNRQEKQILMTTPSKAGERKRCPSQGSMCYRWGGGLGQTRLCLKLEGFALCSEDKSLWLTSIMLDQGSKEEWFQGMVWDIFPAIHSVTLLSLNCCFLCYASLDHLRAWLGVQEGFIITHEEHL